MPEDQHRSTPKLPKTWTRKEVAAAFRITMRHLLDLEKEHGVPILRAGRAVHYTETALEFLKEALRVRKEPLSAQHRRRAAGSVHHRAAQAAFDHARARLREIEEAERREAQRLADLAAPPPPPPPEPPPPRPLEEVGWAIAAIHARNRQAMAKSPKSRAAKKPAD